VNMLINELPVFETLQQSCLESGLRMLQLQGKTLLPVVQGGMGVGVSAGGLAGTVANLGAVGTISSVDLRRLHPDLMARTGHLDKESDARQQIESANLMALDREIKKAQMLSNGRGLIAVNIMKALNQYPGYVAQSLASGVDAIVVGAGLPLDLPELAKDFPNTALIPILSDARGVQLVVRKWEKKGRLPSAIVIEHPKLAGGHLGAASVDDLNDPRFNFDVAIPAILEFFKTAGLEGQIPLIAAGGISCREDILRLQALGASAVQLGTAFAVTQECDAPLAFKEILAHAKPEDLQEFISVAGLPARAVKTPWLEKYIRIESKLQDRAHVKKKCNMSFDCLQHCGLRDGHSKMGQFCIDQQLGHALTGDVQKGLFFRGSGALPFGDSIRSVKELMVWLMSGHAPMHHNSRNG
jgi:nitronate monooxygenase